LYVEIPIQKVYEDEAGEVDVNEVPSQEEM
jgi:hypothetical protein